MKTQTITIEAPPREIPVLALKVEEAAQAIAVGETCMWQLIKDGKIKPVRPGKKSPIIAVEELKRYLRDEAA